MRVTATDRAAEGIKEYIRRHRLRPGDPLPAENELCAELGVSRSSIREAVRMLATLDVVEVRHGHGTYVGAMSLAPLVSGMVLRTIIDVEHSRNSLRHLVETRETLDVSLADELADCYRGVEMGALYAIVTTMSARLEGGEGFAKEDREFHRTLLARISNPLIRELSDAFWQVHNEVVPLLGVPTPVNMMQTVRAHAEILDTLQVGDTEGYVAAVHRHYEPLKAVISSL